MVINPLKFGRGCLTMKGNLIEKELIMGGVFSEWTGTRGVSVARQLDWDETFALLENANPPSYASEETECSEGIRTDPAEVVAAREWARKLTDADVVLAYRNRFNH